jgi:hypothetical protein
MLIPVLRSAVFVLALVLAAFGQTGSNYDPPPVYEEPAPPPPPEPPPAPFWQEINLSEPLTYVKLALLFGSILIARRAFRDMQ